MLNFYVFPPRKPVRAALSAAAGLCLTFAMALAGGTSPAQAAEAVPTLSPAQAFKGSVSAQDDKTLAVSFSVEPGYSLYREKLKFDAIGATLGTVELPAGLTRFDETFNKPVEALRGSVTVSVPVLQAKGPFELDVTYQGCAEQGICFPPQHLRATVELSGFPAGNLSVASTVVMAQEDPSAVPGLSVLLAPPPPQYLDLVPSDASTVSQEPAKEPDAQAAALGGRSFWATVSVFFLAGVLLSLTPCVLPMLPILSAILVGHGTAVTRKKGLGLAFSYSTGMALVYTGLGLAAGLAGEGLAAYMQNPWVLGSFAVLLAALALALLGGRDLRLPGQLSGPLHALSARLPGGQFASVLFMGALSALLVSPCVAAPLAGALVYLSMSRDVWLGGSALFAMAWGMSLPLLALGASAGALLPKAGAWMEGVKRLFGLLLLAVSLWTVRPVLPGALVLALWGGLLLVSASLLLQAHFGRHKGAPVFPFRLAAGVTVGLVGVLQLLGAAAGSTEPLRPLGVFARAPGQVGAAPSRAFVPLTSVPALQTALGLPGKSKTVEVFAEWCASCKEMDTTFADEQVQQQLRPAALYRVDVTANSEEDRALLKHLGLYGPPAVLFFDEEGTELAGTRVIGYQSVQAFKDSLTRAGLPAP